MRLVAGVAALVALMPATPVAAQVAKPDTSRWAIAIDLGLNAARGNSNFTTLASGLRFTHLNKKRYEAEWANGVTYSEGNGRVLARRLVTSLKFDFIPQAVWSPFLFSALERDRIRRINLLSSSGAGAKWTYHRSSTTVASLSGAALYVHKDVLPGAAATIGGEPQGSTARFSLRPKIVVRLVTGFSFEQVSFWQPVFGMAGDYNAEIGTRVGFAASRYTTLYLQHTYRHDSRPPGGIKPDDQLIVAGIKAQF